MLYQWLKVEDVLKIERKLGVAFDLLVRKFVLFNLEHHSGSEANVTENRKFLELEFQVGQTLHVVLVSFKRDFFDPRLEVFRCLWENVLLVGFSPVFVFLFFLLILLVFFNFKNNFTAIKL